VPAGSATSGPKSLLVLGQALGHLGDGADRERHALAERSLRKNLLEDHGDHC
jgi:hypothetical protein